MIHPPALSGKQPFEARISQVSRHKTGVGCAVGVRPSPTLLAGFVDVEIVDPN